MPIGQDPSLADVPGVSAPEAGEPRAASAGAGAGPSAEPAAPIRMLFTRSVAASRGVRSARRIRHIFTVVFWAAALVLLAGAAGAALEGGFGLVAATPAAAAALSLFWLLALFATRRHVVVLHLRRFGSTEETVLRALSFFVGGHLRFVTLYDGSLPPLRTPWADLAAAMIRVPLLAGTLALVATCALLMNKDSEGGQSEALFIGTVVGAVAVALAVVVNIVRLALTRRRRYLRVNDAADVERLVDYANALGGRRWPARHLMPRLVVASAADALWRDAVEKVAPCCDAILVDVSTWSDNLAWEWATLATERSELACIAGAGSPTALARQADGDVTTEPRQTLPRTTVLLYDELGWRAARSFGKDLSNALDNCISASQRVIAAPLVHRLGWLVSVGFFLLVCLAVTILYLDAE